MKVSRYAGLPADMTLDDANKILLGSFCVKPSGNGVNHCIKIPVSSNENVYQLGWNSIAFFAWNGTAFDSFEVNSTQPDHIIDVPQNNETASTVVTRGVFTCTAVAILRGKAMCLLHFDVHDLEPDYIDGTFNKIISHLSTGSGDIQICASYVYYEDSPLEEKFVDDLINKCQTTFTNVNVKKSIIYRGALNVKSNFLTHLEFGIGVDGVTNQPVVFGDMCCGKSVDMFGLDSGGFQIVHIALE